MRSFSLGLRYVPESDGVPVEHFVGFVRGASQTAAAMEQLLVKKLTELGIPLVEDNVRTARIICLVTKEALKGKDTVQIHSDIFFTLLYLHIIR